ncbi:hypothetical protein EV359DRAFT_85825 [Lentinula novae-zelandiae]|nr:hypothetical protein EV359DRAFT_85825 [Lentinula novae-zelandiae]
MYSTRVGNTVFGGTSTLEVRVRPMISERSSPPRTVTLLVNASTTLGNSPQFVFSIPPANITTIPTLWAFERQNPGSSSPSATLQIHEETGTASFDLSKDFTGVARASRSSTILPFQRLTIVHAIVLTFGFLFLLPTGALLARYMRTFTPIWLKGNWNVQFAVCKLPGPIIVIGVALGIQAVVEPGGQHLNDEHKVRFSLLYRHPYQSSPLQELDPRGAALYQVRTGYKTEWPKIGRGPLMAGAYYVYIWVVVSRYLLDPFRSYLPKQYNQENKNNLKQKTYGEMAFNNHKRGQERAMGSPPSEMAEEHHAISGGSKTDRAL